MIPIRSSLGRTHSSCHTCKKHKGKPENYKAFNMLHRTAVIKETLRLYTSNCPPMERIVPSPGMRANGYDIPEGTVVSVAHCATHRDSEVFGEDADLFRPERWLEAGPSSLKRMEHSFMAVRRLLTEKPIADMRKSLVKAIEHAWVVNSASWSCVCSSSGF